MKWQVLIAHAEGEEHFAEQLAGPLRDAGYEVAHRGTVMVGESVVEEASKVLSTGGPVVLCGTVKAVGTGWAHRLVNAARQHPRARVFAVQMEQNAYVQMLSLDDTMAQYWQDPAKAVQDLIASLGKYYPLEADSDYIPFGYDAEQRYRKLALESCDIIDLANLPESDRHIATRQLELRRLYVPLRVRVEIASGTEAGEAELEALEKRRGAPLWGRVDRGERDAERARVSVGQRLTKARRLVVLGEPGAGKTTMIRWIATAYLLRLKRDPDWKDLPDVATLPDEDWLPIIVRCRDLDPSCLGGPLDNILLHTLRKAEMTEAESTALQAVLREKLRQGEALLLLDGLDEVADPAVRTGFCRQLEQIHLAYPDGPIIATSRIFGYREMGYRIGRGFEHVTIAELSEEDKDDFARRWCAVTELPERRETATEELIHDVHSSDRIERLTGNPMLLTTLALVKRKVGKLPNRRADLYWEAVQVLLNWRSEVDEPIDHREAIPQLEYVAYEMCYRGVQQLREDEIIGLFERMREEYPQVHAARKHTADEFLRLLERRTGILVEAGHIRHRGRPVPVFEFRHLTFQEYLAGLALVDGRFPGRNRSRSLAEHIAPLAGRTSEVELGSPFMDGEREVVVTENWREGLRLCVSSCNDDDVDSVLLAMLNPLEGEDAQTTARPRAVLAALCLADEPNASEETVQAVLREFVAQVSMNDGRGAITTSIDAAAMELATSRWAESLRSLLIEEFYQREWSDRVSLSFLCGMVEDVSVPDDEGAVYERLAQQVARMKSGEEVAAIEAASGITYLAFKGKARVVPGMTNGLLTMLTKSAPVAQTAALALYTLNFDFVPTGKAWQPSSAEQKQIISVVSDPVSDGKTVRLLIFILERERDAKSVEPLIARLEDQDSDVRGAAAEALGRIGDARAFEPLLARLEDQDSDVRGAAARALGEIGDEQAFESLLVKLEDQNSDVREAVAEALGRIGDARAFEPLIAGLEDQDSDVRGAAARALGEIGDARAFEPLIAGLEDQDSDVRGAAARALGEIGDARAVEPLIAGLEDQDSDVRGAAARALRRIGDAWAFEPLLARLADQNSDVRRAAAWALGQIGDGRAFESLLVKLEDQNSDVREAAARALGWIEDARAFEPLLARLKDQDSDVREAAARALGWIEGARTVEPLLARLEDQDGDVRGAAAEALGRIRDARAVEPLIAGLEDQDSDVREAVAEALGRIGDARAVGPLLARLEDQDSDVRGAAAEALGRIGDARAFEPLLAGLEDHIIYVRQAAARALGEIGDERAFESLLVKLEDQKSDVREAVAEALGRIGDARAFEPLLARLEDHIIDVRQAAAKALGEIGDERAVGPLLANLEDHVIDVRQAAARELVQLGDTGTIEVLTSKLSADGRNARVKALEALSLMCKDEADRKLLSRDLDALRPFLDPQKEIDEGRVRQAVRRLKMPAEEVRRRYEALAQQFPLKLAWQASS